MSEAKHYVFDKIMKSSAKNYDEINGKTKYVIKIDQREFVVSVAQIRNERQELSDAEKKYWFPELYK